MKLNGIRSRSMGLLWGVLGDLLRSHSIERCLAGRDAEELARLPHPLLGSNWATAGTEGGVPPADPKADQPYSAL